MKIGIVVENFEKNPHETEQINALSLKNEIEKMGYKAVIFSFKKNNVGLEKDIKDFSKIRGEKLSAIYLSGKISNKNFLKLILFALIKRIKIHFRIPSYNLKLFKKFRFFIKIFLRFGILKLYSFDSFHKKHIEKELGIKTEILEPCINVSKDKKKLKKDIDVLFIGSFDDYKRGLFELLEAVRIIKNTKKNIKLKIISRYNLYNKNKKYNVFINGKKKDIVQEVKKKIKNLDIEKNIEFTGKVDDLSLEYLKARCYVLPIKDFKQMPSIPYSVLEALYYNTPVLCTEHYGIGLILDKKFLLDKDFQAGELGEKIIWVLKTKPKVKMQDKFLPSKVAEKFLSYV
jgi:glycosyltransferase involved in cell wall biosynthesis